MDDKRLFEFLRREGDKSWEWHCCGGDEWLTTWEGFGWAWERAQEKGIKMKIQTFIGWNLITIWDMNESHKGVSVPVKDANQIPDRFIVALKEFLEKEAK